jgi:serine/threonine protein kinase
MSYSTKSQSDLEVQRQIDRICLRAEDQWRAGEQPDIENLLTDMSGTARSKLFRELLLIDLDYRARRGITLSEAEYTSRFPDEASTVAEAFRLCRPPAPPLDSWIGTGIGRYDFQKELGRGAFGVVYEAWDEELRRLVAIKVPRLPDDASAFDVDRFISEARTVAQMRHPSILAIYDVLRSDAGHPLLVMEHIAGKSLREYLNAGDFTRDKLIEMIVVIAEAIDFAHRHGFVHRDLDPRNILIDPNGKPVIGDFGLAVHEASQNELAGESAGSSRYMSPEQVRGESHWLDGRADIWALGVILYEILTGRFPFTGADLEQISNEILWRDPKPPRQINPDVPTQLEEICLKCLAKKAVDRYPTGGDLAEALRRATSIVQDRDRLVSSSFRGRGWKMAGSIGAFSAAALLLARFVLSGLASSSLNQFSPRGGNSKGQVSAALPLAIDDIRLSVWRTIDVGHDQLRGVISPNDTSALPLYAQDKVRLSVSVSHPAYLYVFWIDAAGKITPVYPWNQGEWNSRPSNEMKIERLELPGSEESWTVSDESEGTELVAVLASPHRLTTELPIHSAWNQLEPHMTDSPLEVSWFRDGELISCRSSDARAPDLTERTKVHDAVFRNQQRMRESLSKDTAAAALSFPVRAIPSNPPAPTK